jgi:hypothetical protein
MTELEWKAISFDEAVAYLRPCFNHPEEVVSALQDAKMVGPGTRAPQVRTPYRIIRYNAELSDVAHGAVFETALIF